MSPQICLPLLASCFLLAAPLVAQQRIEPPDYEQPASGDVVLGGNRLQRTVTCPRGGAVYVQGQANQVTVKGTCRFVRVQGNRNHVFVEARNPIHVEGNENLIEIQDPATPFSERGERNRIERRGR